MTSGIHFMVAIPSSLVLSKVSFIVFEILAVITAASSLFDSLSAIAEG